MRSIKPNLGQKASHLFENHEYNSYQLFLRLIRQIEVLSLIMEATKPNVLQNTSFLYENHVYNSYKTFPCFNAKSKSNK